MPVGSAVARAAEVIDTRSQRMSAGLDRRNVLRQRRFPDGMGPVSSYFASCSELEHQCDVTEM